MLISIKDKKRLLNFEPKISIASHSFYIPFLTNLEDEIIFKGVEFVTLQNPILDKLGKLIS